MALAPLLALPMSLKGTGFSVLSENTENAVQAWSRKLGAGVTIYYRPALRISAVLASDVQSLLPT